jgi:hypothetical protein
MSADPRAKAAISRHVLVLGLGRPGDRRGSRGVAAPRAESLPTAEASWRAATDDDEHYVCAVVR